MQARLRRVVFLQEMYRVSRRGRKRSRLRLARETLPGVTQFGSFRFSSELDRDGEQVTVQHRNPMALRAQPNLSVHDGAAVKGPEDLPCLGLDLFFLSRDVGDDVVENLIARYARKACARDRLHGDDRHALQTEGIP